MERKSFVLRPMRISDIRSAIRLSDAEGWNQTESDWKLFIENRENICLLAESGNKVIGTTTAINYANRIAWIAMVLVDKEYRGQGVSKTLLTTILQNLQNVGSIKLDATYAGEQVYKKFGFVDEHFISRMTTSSLKELPLYDYANLAPERIQWSNLPEVISFDEMVFGANRSQLIEYLLTNYTAKAWMLKLNNRVTGIILGRNGNKYHHIGPVAVENTGDAKVLITKALQDLVHQPIVVDVLNDQVELITWLQSIGFLKQREFIRMYKDENLFPGDIKKQFLICGPEFG